MPAARRGGRTCPTEEHLTNKSVVVAVCVTAALALSGCDRIKGLIGGKPKGQVVATVNGEEITALELRAELGGFGSRDPTVMKAAQQQALQRIILRRLLADEARKQKLDKSAEFTVQMTRGEETLLAQLYQRKLASTLGTPTRAEAQAWVQSHPQQFAGRRVMFVDQVIAAPNKIPPEQLQPLKSLEEVKSVLDEQGIVHQQNAMVIDTLTTNPAIVAQLDKLPPGEVFLVPQGGAVVFNQITSTKATPFTGEMATNYAMNVLRNQKAQENITKKIEAVRKAAEKDIVYNPAYKPPASQADPAPKLVQPPPPKK
jgi:EpsD family peptidyl-prolyl cis-trans isomerase